MGFMLIACVIDRSKKVIGVRLYDPKSKKVGNYKIENIIGVLRQPGNEHLIDNVELNPTKNSIVGTNGSLSRYAALDPTGKPVNFSGRSPMVVLNRIGEVGFTVVDCMGKESKQPTAKVLEYASTYGVSNGSVVRNENGIQFLRSISGEFPVIEPPKSKLGDRKSLQMGMPITTGVRGNALLAKQTKQMVDSEVEYSDAFKGISAAQKKALEHYYIWYTVKVYKGLAKSIRLSINPNKSAKLAELKGSYDWQFGGVWDTGLTGGAKCELGHPIRYKYFAVPVTEELNENQQKMLYLSNITRTRKLRSFSKELETDKDLKIVFGETCASDFFKISPDDMKMLVKTRKVMSDEIALISDIMTNNTQQEHEDKARVLYGLIGTFGNYSEIIEYFGHPVGDSLVEFTETEIPFPKSLVIEAADVLRKKKAETIMRFIQSSAFGTRGKLDDETVKTIIEICSLPKQSMAFDMKDSIKAFVDFVFTSVIEGSYAYNPFDDEKQRKEVGRYNKETRDEWVRDIYNWSTYMRIPVNTRNTNMKYKDVCNLMSVCFVVIPKLSRVLKDEANKKGYSLNGALDNKFISRASWSDEITPDICNAIMQAKIASYWEPRQALDYNLTRCFVNKEETGKANRPIRSTRGNLGTRFEPKVYTEDNLREIVDKAFSLYEQELEEKRKAEEERTRLLEEEARKAEEARKREEEVKRLAEEARKREEEERKAEEKRLTEEKAEQEKAEQKDFEVEDNYKLAFLKQAFLDADLELDESSRSMTISLDIINKLGVGEHTYGRISRKQVYHIDKAVEEAVKTAGKDKYEELLKKAIIEAQEVSAVESKSSVYFDNDGINKAGVDRVKDILKKADEEMTLKQALTNKHWMIFPVMETVKVRQSCSEKQRKYIEMGFAVFDEWESTNN